MKNRILIIEDNYYKYFTTKEVLESQLRIGVQVVGAKSPQEAGSKIEEIGPHSIINRPAGGVADLLSMMKQKNVNRRNSEVILLITPEGARTAAA